jgi:hypothetical protein
MDTSSANRFRVWLDRFSPDLLKQFTPGELKELYVIRLIHKDSLDGRLPLSSPEPYDRPSPAALWTLPHPPVVPEVWGDVGYDPADPDQPSNDELHGVWGDPDFY